MKYVNVLCWSLFLSLPLFGQTDTSAPDKLTAVPVDTLFFAEKPKGNADTLYHKGQLYTYFRVDLQQHDVRFFWKDTEGRIMGNLGNLIHMVDTCYESRLLFATNGGMYLANQHPQGLYIENGQCLQAADTLKGGYGNFYLQPNGVFMITYDKEAALITTDSFMNLSEVEREKIRYATQSGPLVVANGVVNPLFTKGSHNLNIRSGVGLMAPDQIVFLISDERVNFYDFASVFRDRLECRQALYLDGAISRVFFPKLNKYDTGGHFGVMIGVFK